MPLAKTLLFAGDLHQAQQIIGAAKDHPYPPQQAAVALVVGILALRQRSPVAAAAFQDALAQSQHDLTNTPDNYVALDTSVLAHSGLAITHDPGHITEAADAFHAAPYRHLRTRYHQPGTGLLDALGAADIAGLCTRSAPQHSPLANSTASRGQPIQRDRDDVRAFRSWRRPAGRWCRGGP